VLAVDRAVDPHYRAMHSAFRMTAFALVTAAISSCSRDNKATGPMQNDTTMGFFVTSAKSTTGNLGGLRGADSLCQNLATAAGVGNKTWRAYLSVERDADNGNRPTDARSRIGNGPWLNAKGAVVANNLTELHARKGDSTVFVDERGQPINGQWTGSPAPVEHDIMTGSAADGTLMAGSPAATGRPRRRRHLARSVTRMAWAPTAIPRAPCRPGIRRTPIRTARIRRRAAARDASTASPSGEGHARAPCTNPLSRVAIHHG
jgi:hypothetical protein